MKRSRSTKSCEAHQSSARVEMSLLPSDNSFIRMRPNPAADFTDESMEEISSITRQQLQLRHRDRIRSINEQMRKAHSGEEYLNEAITYGRIRIAKDGVNGILVGGRTALMQWVSEFEFDGSNTESVIQKNDNTTQNSKLSNKAKNVHWKWSPFEAQPPPTEGMNVLHDESAVQIRLCDEVVSLFGNCYNYTQRNPSQDCAANSVRPAEAALIEAVQFYKQRMDQNLSAMSLSSQRATEYIPSRYLDAQQWHQALLGKDSPVCQSSSCGSARDVVLFDVRNIYETNIGTFAPPTSTNTDTKIKPSSRNIEQLCVPPTRECSDLPRLMVLNRDQIRAQCQGKDVMMYCTGGVRCERASKLLKLILTEEPSGPTNSGNAGKKDHGSRSSSNGSNAPKIFQLFGGIEAYLSHVSPEEGLFRGRNFVFDPRMDHGYLYEHFHPTCDVQTDVNSTDVAGEESETKRQIEAPISTCVVCRVTPWGDYTNAHARCRACSIRVLVCSFCVEKYRDGPPQTDEQPKRRGDHQNKVPNLCVLCDICQQSTEVS